MGTQIVGGLGRTGPRGSAEPCDSRGVLPKMLRVSLLKVSASLQLRFGCETTNGTDQRYSAFEGKESCDAPVVHGDRIATVGLLTTHRKVERAAIDDGITSI
jgi:hypothetical protein